MFYSCKSQFRERNLVLPIEKFPFLVLARNIIMLQHVILHFSPRYLSTGQLQEFKTKENFKLFTLNMVVVTKQEVPNIVIWLSNFWYFGRLVAEERWSPVRVGHNRRFDCISYLQVSYNKHWTISSIGNFLHATNFAWCAHFNLSSNKLSLL